MTVAKRAADEIVALWLADRCADIIDAKHKGST